MPSARYSFLEEVAQRRAQARGCDTVADYVHALGIGGLDREWESLIPLITIKESYFFRAPQQFEAIRQQILPELLRVRAGVRRLRIWSAACARGEEPATLALLLSEEPALAGWDWNILATDVDEEALAGARLGLYGERALSGVPPVLLERFFHRRGKLLELDAAVRARIEYRQLNLANPPFPLPVRDYDLILLRNVLIYFRRPLQRWVIAEIGRSLAPHGALFLGASETLWQIQDDLGAVDLGACFCYRHQAARPVIPPPASRPKPGPAPSVSQAPPAPPVPPMAPMAQASRRHPAPEPASEQPPGGWMNLQGPSGWDFGRSDAPPAPPEPAPRVEAPPLRPERPRKRAPELPPEEAAEREARSVVEPCGVHERLAEAARELGANRIDEAGRILAEVLAAEPSEPAAHALEGFLHDIARRTEEAVASYRAALYLDPALYQIRQLLADCLLRLGQRDRAEHQFREVLSALAGGRERELVLYADLPLPSRERVQRRCRQVLQGG